MSNRIKIGDLFKVELGNNIKRYFQYLMLDPAQLNSEVIRVFKYNNKKNEIPDLKEIVKSEVDFFSHVDVKLGVKMNLWKKIGNLPIEKEFTPPFFRTVPLEGHIGPGGKIKYGKTSNWIAWQAGGSFTSREKIGELNEDTIAYDLGMVFPPIEVVCKMETGEYSEPYFT